MRWKDDEAELHVGVPPHLRHELIEWVAGHLDDDVNRAIIRNLRLPTDPGRLSSHLWTLSERSPEQYLRVVAFILERYCVMNDAARLEVMLMEGGSAWRVSELLDGEGFGLEERVDSTAQAQYDEVAEPDDSASVHLRKAWHAAFGIDPEGDTAYREAVKAVEAALNPLVAPADASFTLGKGIKNMRQGASKFILDPRHRRTTPSIDHFIGMCSLLWDGQARHGEQDTIATNSREEGVAAVHLGVAIVSLVKCGAFRSAAANA